MQPQTAGLTAVEVMTATGCSRRTLTRLLKRGIVQIVARRYGRGRGRGKDRFEYLPSTIETIRRLDELRQRFRKIEDCRWRLWGEKHPVRIAPDLARTLSRIEPLAQKIRSLEDIETKLLPALEPALELALKHADSYPLAVFLRRLDKDDLRSVVTMLCAFVLGIRLPLFDERDPAAFQIFKRLFGLPPKWELPPQLFEALPHLHDQLPEALMTASAEELEVARPACRCLSLILDYPDDWCRGIINIEGVRLPRATIKWAALVLPYLPAITVALIIVGMRAYKSAFGEDAAAAFAKIASGTAIHFPPEIIGLSLQDCLPGLQQTPES